MQRLPVILAALAALATLLIVGPVAIAVALLRSSSDAEGPTLAAQIVISCVVVAIVAAVGIGVWGLARFLGRRFARND